MVLKVFQRQNLYILAIFFIGVSASLSVALYHQKTWRAAVAQSFREAGVARIDAITQLLGYNAIVLKSVNALYQASENVSQREFQTFSAHLLENTPYLRAIEWVPRVTQEERAATETTQRERNPDFAITQRGADGGFVPAAEHVEYYPVIYAAPEDINAPVIGYDIGSDPDRKDALAAPGNRGR